MKNEYEDFNCSECTIPCSTIAKCWSSDTDFCCLDCKHSYIEDIWYELSCDMKQCNFERKE